MSAQPKRRAARAIADLGAGIILATVDIAVSPERVFRALSSEEVTRWWGSDDTYRTTSWEADARPGGRWRCGGVSKDGHEFSVGGDYLEVDPPRKLVQTWAPDWDPGPPTTITYLLDPIAEGTRLTLRHEGFVGRAESCAGHAEGWERVLGWLDGHLAPVSAGGQYFLCKLLPPRPSFAMDMTAAEREVMGKHVVYWTGLLAEGKAIVFGPVADPEGGFGVGVVRVADEAELRRIQEGDPARLSGMGFRQEATPMLQAVHG
jgi:uncharacterized protein YndB with AHSA1/START domain